MQEIVKVASLIPSIGLRPDMKIGPLVQSFNDRGYYPNGLSGDSPIRVLADNSVVDGSRRVLALQKWGLQEFITILRIN